MSHWDKDRANEKLRWAIGLLKENTWLRHPENKILVIEDQIGILYEYGFWWQARVLSHQLTLFKKSLQNRSSDTPRRGGASS